MITLLIALSALVIVLIFIHQLSRHVDLGLFCLLFVELYKYTLGASQGVFGSLHLDPLDGITICLILAGLLRTAQRLKRLNATHLISFAVLLLFALSLARGVISNGFFAVANESRGYTPLLITLLYFLDAPTDDKSIRRYVWMYVSFAAALCVIAVLANLGLPVGSYAYYRGSVEGVQVAEETGRYLPVAAAGVIAISAFFSLALTRQRRWGIVIRQLPFLFFAAAIYLRHRTVWMVLLAGSLCLLPLHGKLFRRLLPVFLVALAIIAGIVIYGSNEGAASADQFTDSATNSETWMWRVNGWLSLLQSDDENAATVLVGKSMGSGYWRVDPQSGRTVTVQAHNEYLADYLRIGSIGLVLLLCLFVRPLAKLWRFTKIDPDEIYPSTSAWAVILIMMLVYSVTYSIDETIYPLLGIANALMDRLRVAEIRAAFVEDEEWGSESMRDFAGETGGV